MACAKQAKIIATANLPIARPDARHRSRQVWRGERQRQQQNIATAMRPGSAPIKRASYQPVQHRYAPAANPVFSGKKQR